MRLDPISLRLFVAVVEEKTIAGAAEREHIAAAAISKRIRDLEELLGSQLIIRSNKGIVPTAAGAALLSLARGALHDFDEIFAQMRDYSSGTRGFVRVVANISAITQFMPTALKSFLIEHPLVQIRLDEMTSGEILRVVAENGADIGLFSAWPLRQDVEVYPFRNDELVLAVPKQHFLARKKSVLFSETLDFDYVGLGSESSINLQLSKAAAELGRIMKLRMHVTSFDALCLMVEAGLGIGILPRGSSAPYLKSMDIRIIPLGDAWVRRDLKLCVRSYQSLSNAAKLLTDHLRRLPSDK
jgi:DNA-binding transcriptional LysR family regulator